MDNTNYANPAVLARINSILEADGHVLINEYHQNGTSIKIQRNSNFKLFLTEENNSNKIA